MSIELYVWKLHIVNNSFEEADELQPVLTPLSFRMELTIVDLVINYGNVNKLKSSFKIYSGVAKCIEPKLKNVRGL